MGVTNIHYADQLVQRAGQEYDGQAFIEPFHKPVYIMAGKAEKGQLQRIMPVMSGLNLQNEQWVLVDPFRKEKPKERPIPLEIPQVFISPALGLDRRSPTTSSQVPDLYFVAVIQDLTGGERVKFIVRSSVEALARSMMHEAVNGYSVVLTGALLKTMDILDLPHPAKWVHVDSIEGLQRIANEAKNSGTIRKPMGFFC